MNDYESVNWRLLLKVAESAGLNDEELYRVREYVEVRRDPYDFMSEPAYEKLYGYFLNTNEMPYDVAKARDRVTPDFWILDYFNESTQFV